MLGARINPRSTLVDVPYHSMEEVNEVARQTGWRGDYRQLGKGSVTSRWRSLHLGESSLISHRVNNRIHVRVAPPEVTVALGIAARSSTLLVDGVTFGEGQWLVIDGEMDFVTPAVAHALTLVLPRPVFEENARALFPRMPTNEELLRISQCSLSEWSALQGDFENLLGDGSLSPEELSVLFSRFIDLMAGDTDEHWRENCLGNRSTRLVARLAEDYIENHYRDTIRMEDLCRCAGVSMRTLQRSFAEYFQITPLMYLKSRRLHATRKALVAGDSSRNQVTPIALDNGFTHLGRFSIDYRAHFGESPRETLARRAPSKVCSGLGDVA